MSDVPHRFGRRRATGFAIAVGLPSLIALLALTSLPEVVPALLFVAAIAVVAALTGTAGGLLAAAASGILYTYFFTQPPQTFTLEGANDVAAVVSFVAVGLCVGQIVAYEQRMRARVGRAQRQAEESANRLSRLATLARALAGVRFPHEVLDVVLRDDLTASRAQAGLIALVGADGSTLEVAEHSGYRADRLEAWLGLAVEPHQSLAETVLAGRPVYLPTAAERDPRSPLPATPSEPSPALAALPLAFNGRSITGLLLLSFGVEQEFGSERRTLLEALAAQVAQALERTLVNQREAEARRLAESSRAQLERSNADLDAERARLVTLVERLDEGVIAVDPNGAIAFANTRAKKALDQPALTEGPLPEEWYGFPLRSFATGLFGAVDRVEAEVGSRESDTHYSIVGLPPALSETALLVIGDLSERERRERAEHEFVTNAAHELRTPLTSISLAVAALQSGAKDVPRERDLFLSNIERESARLNRLANSLLILARAQSTAEPPRDSPFPLRPLLAEILEGLERKEDVEVVLSCPQRLRVVTNRDLLEQVILNLATNAVRYTERGTVRVAARGRPDGSATVEVRDTGPGIPVDSRRSLFDRFYRGDDSSEEGFGLGLAIVWQAVEALGGRIALETAPDAGTVARVELPATVSSAAA